MEITIEMLKEAVKKLKESEEIFYIDGIKQNASIEVTNEQIISKIISIFPKM